MPALYKLFAICFLPCFRLVPFPAGRSPRFGFAVLRTSYPGRMRGSRSFFSVFYSLFLVPEPVSFIIRSRRSAPVVRALSGRLRSGFRYAVPPLPVRGNETLSSFGAVRLDWQRRASYPAVQVCRERGLAFGEVLSGSARPAMRRIGFSLSAGVRPRTA